MMDPATIDDDGHHTEHDRGAHEPITRRIVGDHRGGYDEYTTGGIWWTNCCSQLPRPSQRVGRHTVRDHEDPRAHDLDGL